MQRGSSGQKLKRKVVASSSKDDKGGIKIRKKLKQTNGRPSSSVSSSSKSATAKPPIPKAPPVCDIPLIRTVSGMPLCSLCHGSAGMCEHTDPRNYGSMSQQSRTSSTELHKMFMYSNEKVSDMHYENVIPLASSSPGNRESDLNMLLDDFETLDLPVLVSSSSTSAPTVPPLPGFNSNSNSDGGQGGANGVSLQSHCVADVKSLNSITNGEAMGGNSVEKRRSSLRQMVSRGPSQARFSSSSSLPSSSSSSSSSSYPPNGLVASSNNNEIPPSRSTDNGTEPQEPEGDPNMPPLTVDVAKAAESVPLPSPTSPSTPLAFVHSVSRSSERGIPSTTVVPVTGQTASFYVYCDSCTEVKPCRLAVLCAMCHQSEPFRASRLPRKWDECFASRVSGSCRGCGPSVKTWAVFIPHCTECDSLAAPLLQVVRNVDHRLCVGCWSEEDVIVNFQCQGHGVGGSDAVSAGGGGSASADDASNAMLPPHVQCIECFKNYASMSVTDRKLVLDKSALCYTVTCPLGCSSSSLDTQMFRILGAASYKKFKRFSALNFADDNQVVWCPRQGCNHGFIPPKNQKKKKLTCPACQRSHCRLCRKKWHRGACATDTDVTRLSEADQATLDLINEVGKLCIYIYICVCVCVCVYASVFACYPLFRDHLLYFKSMPSPCLVSFFFFGR